MKLTPFLCAGVIAIFAASGAAAQDFGNDGPRWYGEFDLGYHWPGKVDSTSTRPAPDGLPYNWVWRPKSDWAMTAELGYRFTPHLRAELQVGFENSGLASARVPNANRPGEPRGLCALASVLPNCIPTGQENANWSWMLTGGANVIYDVAPSWRLDPFIGAGVGLAHIEWPTSRFLFSNVPGPISASNPAMQFLRGAGTLNRTGQFDVQFLGGASYRVTPRIHLVFTYRHYLTPGLLRWNPDNVTRGVDIQHGLQPGDFTGRFQDDSATVGLRYGF